MFCRHDERLSPTANLGTENVGISLQLHYNLNSNDQEEVHQSSIGETIFGCESINVASQILLILRNKTNQNRKMMLKVQSKRPGLFVSIDDGPQHSHLAILQVLHSLESHKFRVCETDNSTTVK
jgi:hypothetical protein